MRIKTNRKTKLVDKAPKLGRHVVVQVKARSEVRETQTKRKVIK